MMGVRVRILLMAVLATAGLTPTRTACGAPTRKKVANAEYPPEFRAQVRKAIERGVQHLRTEQIRDPVDLPPDLRDRLKRLGGDLDGRRDAVAYEEAAAVTWVLRRAGVPADDPGFAKAVKVLGARAPKTIEEASLLLLGLAALPLPQGDPFAMEDGSKPADKAPPVSEENRVRIDGAVQFVLDRQVKTRDIDLGDRTYDNRGGWGREMGTGIGRRIADVPTTYLALIALEAGARSGAAVPPKTYVDALDLLLGWQAKKGPAVTLKMDEVRGADRFEWTEKAQARGFGWSGPLADSPSGYDTVAGTLGVLVCVDALQEDRALTRDLRRATETAIRDGLAWVQQRYAIGMNPVTGNAHYDHKIEGPLYHHHWLQGLARLAIHARMRFVGSHDWYREGAEHLMKTQREDGSWAAIWWQNCYALLFLMRASLRSTVPVVTDLSK